MREPLSSFGLLWHRPAFRAAARARPQIVATGAAETKHAGATSFAEAVHPQHRRHEQDHRRQPVGNADTNVAEVVPIFWPRPALGIPPQRPPTGSATVDVDVMEA